MHPARTHLHRATSPASTIIPARTVLHALHARAIRNTSRRKSRTSIKLVRAARLRAPRKITTPISPPSYCVRSSSRPELLGKVILLLILAVAAFACGLGPHTDKKKPYCRNRYRRFIALMPGNLLAV